MVFCFKQKPAYEMRISDWSSDVCSSDLDALAGNLSHGEKQWLEIGMVVATEAELLLLDEPTAGMGDMESTQTSDIVKTLVGEHAVLVIDHDIDFAAQLTGHVVLLHQGSLLRGDTPASTIDSDARRARVGTYGLI